MDYHSKLLISLKSNGQSSASEISDVVIGWKNTFSFYWYHQYINDDQKKLDFVFNLLFELTEFPDSNVTIASFNAIGALLVSLSPFRSQELILSFKNTLSSLEVSPNTSCAVIATFVFLSHHVSDNSISHFIESTPIFPHFGADLRTFIHHIPNLIEQMDRLNMEFHQALLRSLISSFGRNPVSSFIESIMLLVKRFPNKLLSDLMEFIESNNLEDTLLSVGGPILNNNTYSEILSIKQKYKFLNALKNKLFIPKSESSQNEGDTPFTFNESDYTLQTEVTATELEQIVSIICGLRKQSEEELRKCAKTISDSVWNHRNELKSVFQRILFPLANNVNELRPTKDDTSNEMSRKIMALSAFENADDEAILSICEPFIDSRDECFISVLTFLSKSMKEKCHRLFKKLFEKDDYSWVQRIAILNLIDSIDQFKMDTFMSDYNQKCIDFLIKCALSLQTELSSQSREVISRFVSLNNVELFRDSILKCDFFNFQITKNILMLLNVIVNSISPAPLRCFIGIVLELFDFTLSDIINNDSDDSAFEGINIYPSFVADCFEFLSHYPGLFQYRRSIERICMCKMQEVYYSFTQEKLFFQSMLDNSSQASSSTNEAVSQSAQMLHSNRKKAQAASQMSKMLKNNVRPILSTITTDVVADASLVRYEFLKPLENCLQYLVSNQMQSAAYRSVFLKLLPIFPKEILPYFYEQSSVITNCIESNIISFLSPEEIESIRPKILRIFNSNRDQVVIARCCEFFYQSKVINQQILIQVKNIVENTKIKSSSSAFEFFKLIYSVEPESALNYLKRMLNISNNNKNEQEKSDEKISLSNLTKNELALLASNIPSVYSILSDLEDFSFLQYKTNRFSAKSWFERNDYTSWPLTDPDLAEEIKKMFDKSYSVHIKDCSLIDNQHWIFIMKNKTLFYRDTIKEYLNSNKYMLKSICIFNMSSDVRNHFNFSTEIQKDIEANLDKFAKFLPTTALLLKKGKFIKNEILIKNFLRFSKIQVNDDLLNKMKEEFPNLSSNFNDYTTRLAKRKMKKEQQKTVSERIIITKSDSDRKEEQNQEPAQMQPVITNDDKKEELITEEKEKQDNVLEDKKDEIIEHGEQVAKQNEENQIKKDELGEEQKENQEEQHIENQAEPREKNGENKEEQAKTDENQIFKNEQHLESDEQVKQEEQQINQEVQQQQQQNQEEQKEESQIKQNEQTNQEEEKQINQENQQVKTEEQREENRLKQEEQQINQEVQQQPQNQEEENQMSQEVQQVKQEEQREENQSKQEEQPNQEKQKEGDQLKQVEEQQTNHEEQKEENQLQQEEHRLESNEQPKQDEQKEKAEEQKEENQLQQEEKHLESKEQQKQDEQQEKLEEHKEESQIQQEEHHLESSEQQKQDEQQEKLEEQKEESQIQQEEHHLESSEQQKQDEQQEKPEEQKEENQLKQEEQNQIKQDEEQHQASQEGQKDENQLNIELQNKQEDQPSAKPNETAEIQPSAPPKKEEQRIQNHQHKRHDSQLAFPVASSISDFDPNFPMKSKFLKKLCHQPPKDTVIVTMYRMHLINRIGEICRRKQFFYFLRFLRINLVIFKNSREALAIRKNTVENFTPIARKLRELGIGRSKTSAQSMEEQEEADFDFFEEEKDLSSVLLEFVKLSSKLFPISDLHRVIKSVSVPGKTESIELLLVSNLVIHSSKFRNMVNNVFSVSNSLLSNYSIHQLKSSNLSRLPSFLSFIITNIKMLPDEESSMFFTRHYQHLLDDEIVSDMAIEFLSFYLQNQQGLKKYEEYFDGNVITQIALLLFDTKRSIFKKAGEKSLLQILFALMKGQFKNQLLQFEPLIEKLSVCGYSLPFAINLATSYFSTVAFNLFQIPITQPQKKMLEAIELKEKQSKKGKSKILTDEQKRQNMLNFQKDFGIKEIRIVQSIFRVCPSITNALKLSKTLILASSYFDSLALIFGKLAPFDDGCFLGIFCIATLFYFEFINDDEKRKRFIELVKNLDDQNATFKSRIKALRLVIDKQNEDSLNFEVAFAVACLETNDNDKIEEVINLFAE